MIVWRVAEMMAKRKIKAADLAKKTGIRPSTISALWYGTSKRIDIRQLDNLCKVLECLPQDLLVFLPDQSEQLSDDL